MTDDGAGDGTAPTGGTPASRAAILAELFRTSLRLGLTSFGGPIAHIGFFREEYVGRRRWLSDRAFAELVALCQFLPGPASSQVGMGVGLYRAGIAGALVAWLGFTLPSALVMTALGLGIGGAPDGGAGWMHGLKLAAVAVVAQALLAMVGSLAPDRPRASIAVGALFLAVLAPVALGQIAAILLGAGLGILLPRRISAAAPIPLPRPLSRRVGIAALALFAALLVGLPLVAALSQSHALDAADAFYRAGALVFGGGHVILPLLEASVVEPGWIAPDTFLAGYGAAQALPGPLTTFAAFLGAAMEPAPHGIAGALICLAAIFLPSLLLVIGALPFWTALANLAPARRAMAGANAAVVGLLAAALYDPVWTSTVAAPTDFAVLVLAFAALQVWRVPAWATVAACAVAGAMLPAG